MHTIKSSIPKPIKDQIKNAPLTKSIFKKDKKLTPEQEEILHAKESLDKPASVLFFTTHKCASSFISPLFQTITSNSNFELKDYAGAIWNLGDQLDIDQDKEDFLSAFLENAADRLFFRRGEIYAPLRIPVDFPERRNLKHIFFLRDPRDVMVSSYYSFGFTHGLPKNSKLRKRRLLERQRISEQGIDNYVVSDANNFLNRYLKYKEFVETSDSYLYLKYDDFQSDPLNFIETITKYLDITIPKQERQQLAEKASPVQITTDETKHKRSGKSKQYLKELKPETIEILNKKFAEVLEYWNFE